MASHSTSAGNSMIAARIVQYRRDLSIDTIPIPRPGKYDALVKIDVCGVCHTDLHVQEDDWGANNALPRTPGHEGVGKVVELGEAVTRLKVGDRVCIPWLHYACRSCPHCIAGCEFLCAQQRNTGFNVNGSFANYCVANADYVGIVPDVLSDEQAAPICCAGVTVYAALKNSGGRLGQWCAITGAAGGLGHLAIQYAKIMGLRTIGIDVGKNDFLYSMGCDVAIDAFTDDVVKKVMEVTTEGAHVAILLAPYEESMNHAVKYTRSGGCIVQVAIPSWKTEFDTALVVIKGLTIRGSIVGSRQDLQEALDIAALGNVKCSVDLRPFSEVNDVLHKLKDGKITGRVVLRL